MRILITGASGGLGRNVLDAAIAQGHEVRALVRDPNRLSGIDPAVQLISGDARDPVTLQRAADSCEALFHLVNVSFGRDWTSITAALLEAAVSACASSGARLVFPANVWVFGCGVPGRRVSETQGCAPCSEKGRARQAKEERIRASGVRFVMIRLPEFYGPHVQTLTGPPLQRIAQHRSGVWFGPKHREVEFVYMPDAARALLAIGLAPTVDGEIFHLPGAAAITPASFFAKACTAAGGGGLLALPSRLVRAAAPFHAQARGFADILHLWTDPILLDGTKLHARFPELVPTPYEVGLQTTIDWLRRNPHARMYY